MSAGIESLGIESLSAVLKRAGHEVMLILDEKTSFDNEKEVEKVLEKVKGFRSDLLCFSVFTETYAYALTFARICKQRLGKNITNVFGGIHVTSVPETVIAEECVDFAMRGECEVAILEFLQALEGKRTFENVSNLIYKDATGFKMNPVKSYIRDLDSLPFLDKDIFYSKIPALSKDYYIMIGRGCPFACSYCCNSIFHSLYGFEKNHLRRRSVANVIEELMIAKQKYKPHMISFMDDIFVLRPKEWLYPFLEEYKKKIDLPFYCQIHPSFIRKEIVVELIKAKCWNITVGVQSGSQRIRKDFFGRSYRNNPQGANSNEGIIEACNVIRHTKAFLTLDMIFGCPTETQEDVNASVDIIERIAPSRVTNFFLAYYPNTKLTNYAIEKGLLSKDIATKFMDGKFVTKDFIFKQAGEYIMDRASGKMYGEAQTKMQLVCIFRSAKIAKWFYGIIEAIPYPFILTVAKTLSILASLLNYDRRGYQRILVKFGKRY